MNVMPKRYAAHSVLIASPPSGVYKIIQRHLFHIAAATAVVAAGRAGSQRLPRQLQFNAGLPETTAKAASKDCTRSGARSEP